MNLRLCERASGWGLAVVALLAVSAATGRADAQPRASAGAPWALPTLGVGQGQPAPADSELSLPVWDAGGNLGLGLTWVGTPQFGRYKDETLTFGVSVGRYWTEHAKSEVECIWPGETTTYSSDAELAEAYPAAWVYVARRIRPLKVGFLQVYQFGHNAWVHPYLGVGLDVDIERITVDRPAQTVSVSQSDRGGPLTVDVPATHSEDRSVRLRGAVVAGLKAYVSRHAFTRFDVRAAGASRLDQVAFRAGFGLDF